jgi:signal transduction histidine kinase
MQQIRLPHFLAGLLAVAVALGAWAFYEAQRQRTETAEALIAEAGLLSEALGPGLLAAASAVREVDELVIWKLLDNAHLVADWQRSGGLREQQLERILTRNGLDAIVTLDSAGGLVSAVGDSVPQEILAQLGELWRGEVEDLVLGTSVEEGVEHLGVATAIGGGGAVVVRIHALSARTLVRRLGVKNLLRRLTRTPSVLYLEYQSPETGAGVVAAWDDGPLPPARDRPELLTPLRGRAVFEVTLPLEVAAGERAWLRVGLDGAPLERAATAAAQRTLFVSIVFVGFALVALGLAYLLRLRAEERQAATLRIAAAERARTRSERLAAAGLLTAGLAHEVRSPLNAIGLSAQRLERKARVGPDGEDVAGFAGAIRREVARLEGILRSFLELARPAAEVRERVALEQLLRDVQGLLQAEAAAHAVRLEEPRGAASARVDRQALQRARINLLRNAIPASPAGERVECRLEQDGERIQIRIRDHGRGIAAEMAEKLFTAFATDRAGGTGLGLALVLRVAEEHGGECRLQNHPQGGAVATLTIGRGLEDEER